VISDKDVEDGKLTDVLLDLLNDDSRRAGIRKVAQSKAVYDTNERIIKAIRDVMDNR